MSKGRVVLLEKPSDLGSKAMIVTDRGVEFGSISPLKHGQPINGRELLHVRGTDEAPVLDLIDRTKFGEEGDGPAMVNSQEFRDNYDKIFGGEDVLLN